ncbi:alanine/glycine:cation symporter family protein [Exiguobacterium sp.]|uniref:alanine/glycine:cation symporter family protein n=1 Tax=Exiguobacterium sp. TaxID=44751 RepID=UPI00263BC0DF|nr:alanine/glycine:cation symporter family protein [Exiguobacterium sp.]MCC5892292.1 alanine:cation symporter family protein [Exiguobacterium sp.]
MEAVQNLLQGSVDFLNNVLWTYVLIVALVGAGIYFTIKTRFMQFRYLKEMFRVVTDKSDVTLAKDGKSISSAKSFFIGAATRIGTGNLAGVTVAITLGGPGAVFWMWIVALLGGATAMIESTLAQVYKVKDDVAYRGGPAYYIEKGLNNRVLGIIFAVLIAFTFGLIFNSVQSNTIAAAFDNAFGLEAAIGGAVLVVLTGLVIFGGVQRVANFSAIVVPFMAVLYLIVALYVVVVNITEMPAVLGMIFQSAFGLEQAFGGSVGAAIMMGVRRGLFSNEAGMGSAPNAAATAEVSHPAKQGFMQTLGVFLDTLIVCTATAAIVLLSDSYASGNGEGIALLQNALAEQIGSWAPAFIAISVLLFAFSSIVGSYYYGETNIEFIKKSKGAVFGFRLLTMGFVFLGSVASLGFVWSLADLFMAGMTLINLAAITLLGGVAFKVLRDYEEQRAQGLNPRFSARKLGIENTECWDVEEDEVAQGTVQAAAADSSKA